MGNNLGNVERIDGRVGEMSASVANKRVPVGKFGVLLKENLVLRAWRTPLTSL
jgi:hypothetical protein